MTSKKLLKLAKAHRRLQRRAYVKSDKADVLLREAQIYKDEAKILAKKIDVLLGKDFKR